MTRTCAPDENTRITHTVNVPECCPVSGNPRAGSTLSISYIPTTGLVFPVEDLEAMTREYVGGLGSIRAMEEMIQHIHVRVTAVVGVAVSVKADLRIAPPFGGAEQGMVIEVGADMLTTLAARPDPQPAADTRVVTVALLTEAQDLAFTSIKRMRAGHVNCNDLTTQAEEYVGKLRAIIGTAPPHRATRSQRQRGCCWANWIRFAKTTLNMKSGRRLSARFITQGLRGRM